LMSLIKQKFILPLAFELPWIDAKTLPGFVINVFNQMFQSNIIVILYMIYDGIQASVTMHVYCLYDDLCLMLDELEVDLRDRKKKHSIKIQEKLFEIIGYHRDLLRFAKISELI
jgi:hypothetical protein